MNKEAQFWQSIEGLAVQCYLCPHNCKIPEGKTGICGVRKNQQGMLFSEIYGEVTGYGLDPIEKKPLYHYYPSHQILSLGTKGCNFKCPYCQNWHISQDPDTNSNYLSPEKAVAAALRDDSFGISYTYSEPLIWIEYVMDTAILARQRGLKNVLVTNGFINPEPLEKLIPVVDAANIDVKSFDPEFYKTICKGRLEPVLETCERVIKDWHIEITHLMVPFKKENELLDDIEKMCKWMADKLGKDVPLHLSRYFPNYKMKLEATPVAMMKKAAEIASKYLNFVYLGNVMLDQGNDTVCPKCGTVLIERVGYNTHILSIKDSRCTNCGNVVAIPGT